MRSGCFCVSSAAAVVIFDVAWMAFLHILMNVPQPAALRHMAAVQQQYGRENIFQLRKWFRAVSQKNSSASRSTEDAISGETDSSA